MIRHLVFVIALIVMLVSCKERQPENEGLQEEPEKEIKKEVPKKDTIQKPEVKPAPKPPSEKIYIVKSGEWLWDIARKEYGTAIGWFRIYEANHDKIRDPDLIYPGQKFVIPDFKRKK